MIILKPTEKGYIVENTKTKYVMDAEISLDKASEIMEQGAIIDATNYNWNYGKKYKEFVYSELYTNRQVCHMIAFGRASVQFNPCSFIKVAIDDTNTIKISGYIGCENNKRLSSNEISKLIQTEVLYWLILRGTYRDITEYQIHVEKSSRKYDIGVATRWNMITGPIWDIRDVHIVNGETLTDSIRRWNAELNSGHLIVKRNSDLESYMYIPKGKVNDTIDEIKYTVNA